MKKMRVFIFLLLLSLCLGACKTEKEEAEHISLQTTVLADSLYTQMPGRIFLCEPYLVWHTAFTRDTFLCVTDLRTGELVGEMGKMGRGPKEFGTPSPGSACGRKVVVRDANLPRLAFYSVDSLLAGKDPVQMLPDLGLAKMHCTYFAEIDSALYVGIVPGASQPFRAWTPDGRSFPFGERPLADSIVNGFDAFQGILIYNPVRRCLLYANVVYPYMALYERQSDDSFVLKKKRADKFSYTINDQKLSLGKDVEGLRGVSLTKDYIVVRIDEPKGSVPPTSGVRDMSRKPRKVYLYDYDLNLKKVVDLDMQVLSTAANVESNKIYIMGIKNSYCIAECNIPE